METGREPTSKTSLIIALYAVFAVVAVVIGGLRGDGDIYRLSPAPPWKLLLSWPLGVVVGLGLVFVSRLCVHRFDWARRLHGDFRGLLGTLRPREILVLAAASTVGEELFFRGALLPAVGVWLQAGLFAVGHIGPGRRFLPWTASAFLVGLLFGAVAQAMGDLGAPIAAHFTINYLNLRFIVRVHLPAA